MDKQEGKEILDILRGIQVELEQTRVHVIELENRIMFISGILS